MLNPPISYLQGAVIVGREKNLCNNFRPEPWLQNTSPEGSAHKDAGWKGQKPRSQTCREAGGRVTAGPTMGHAQGRGPPAE